MKITQFGHGVCSTSGKPCDCCLAPEHRYAITRETTPTRTDTGRFLAAGAHESYWVRTAVGQLHHAVPAIRELLNAGGNVIIESNSILEFFSPEIYLVVLDYAQSDFKSSGRRWLERADALVVINRGSTEPAWNRLGSEWRNKPRFLANPPHYVTGALSDFVRERLACATEVH